MAQVVEHLPRKQKALSSNASIKIYIYQTWGSTRYGLVVRKLEGSRLSTFFFNLDSYASIDTIQSDKPYRRFTFCWEDNDF
jgi:hypothetical protein